MPLFQANIVNPMDFMVLGPLRVEDSGTPVPVGGPKQRTVLALLVASAGGVVSMDSLLMGAYGPDVDPRSRRSVQTWISDFRRHMDGAVERRGDGYVLAVDPLSIDAMRFEERVRSARRARQDEVAAELLREGLALWRGPPYTDVEPSPPLEAECRRLEALRATALDRRITLDLEAGKHRQLVSELELLVAEHPHDESLRAHQMVALYRCGRQADALRAFRRSEEILREELGVDPSPALRELEHRILTQDHALDYQPAARARLIPARYTTFVGRNEEVAEVRGLVAENRLTTITGPGGVGKSSLAVEVARSFLEDMQVVFVPTEADRQANPWQVIAASLGLRPADGADLRDLIVGTIGEAAMMLLLDGVEHVLDDITAIVPDLLTSCPNLHLLVTTREPFGITGERVFELAPLGDGPGSAANRLFLDRSGLRESTLDATGQDHITAIGREVSGLPLGIELAAARARTLPLDEIRARMVDQPTLLANPRGAVPRQQSIVATMNWSYDLLTPHSRANFRRLGALPTGRLPSGALAHLFESDTPHDDLAPLIDASLVAAADGDEYVILEPIRQYAEMKLAEAGELEEVRLRYARWIVALCHEVQDAGLRGDSFQGVGILRRRGANIAAIAAWAAERGYKEIVLGIVAGAGRYWPHVADPELLIVPGLAVIDDAKEVEEGLRLRALGQLAFLHTPGKPKEAAELLARLESEYLPTYDHLTEHVVRRVMAVVPYRMKRGADASRRQVLDWLDHHQRSMAAAVELGYPAETGLWNEALLVSLLGDPDGEKERLEQLAEWAGDERPLWRGMALQGLGKLQYLDGDRDGGVASVKEAARILVEGGDLDFAAEAEYLLAYFFVEYEQFDQAAEALDRVDRYHRQIGLPPATIDDPDAVAYVAAGRRHWEQFEVAARKAFAEFPAAEEVEAFNRALRGRPPDTSRLARMVTPVATYLAARGRTEDACVVLNGMALVLEEAPDPGVYERIGTVDIIERLKAESGCQDGGAGVSSLEELLAFMTDAVAVRADRIAG